MGGGEKCGSCQTVWPAQQVGGDTGLSSPAKCSSVSETNMSPAPYMGPIDPLLSGSQNARADPSARVP